MQTLDNALRSYAGKGREITIPFARVNEAVDFRTGDLAVLAAAPGGGKSLAALNWAWRSKDSLLYLAQDSPRSVLRRLVALGTGSKVAEVDEDDALYWADRVQGKREDLIISMGAHSVEQVEKQVIALTEWLMEPPKMIMIDNLFDMQKEGSNYMENSFYAEVLPQLKQLAIEQDVGIVVMHHVGRGGDKGKKEGQGTEPLQLTSLLFAGEREARHVWGLYRSQDKQRLFWQVLKQQDGAADAGGNLQLPLRWSTEDGRLYSDV